MEITLQPPAPFSLSHLERIYASHGDSSCGWIGLYYKEGIMVSVEESREFFERFSPWKHLAGYYLLMDYVENGKSYQIRR